MDVQPHALRWEKTICVSTHDQKTPTKHSRKYGSDGMEEDFLHSHTLRDGQEGTIIGRGTKIYYIFTTIQNE